MARRPGTKLLEVVSGTQRVCRGVFLSHRSPHLPLADDAGVNKLACFALCTLQLSEFWLVNEGRACCAIFGTTLAAASTRRGNEGAENLFAQSRRCAVRTLVFSPILTASPRCEGAHDLRRIICWSAKQQYVDSMNAEGMAARQRNPRARRVSVELERTGNRRLYQRWCAGPSAGIVPSCAAGAQGARGRSEAACPIFVAGLNPHRLA